MQAEPLNQNRAAGPASLPSERQNHQEAASGFLAQLRAGAAPVVAPSIVLVAAHPDDEVIGAGAQLSRLETLALVHVTDGAPRDMRDARAAGFSNRQDYARARRDELQAALALAGHARTPADTIGIADQEAALALVTLTHELVDRLRRARPGVVLTQPYEGGHPDHDATAFAVHAACRLLEREGGAAPAIVEMSAYHSRDGALAAFAFLPHDGHEVVTLPLDDAQRQLKRRMIDCFTSQAVVLAQFPVELERFRAAPAYDFTRPPHAGRLYYEFHDWGMTGDRWRRLAGEALEIMQIAAPP